MSLSDKDRSAKRGAASTTSGANITLADRVYDHLVEQIASGAYAPEARLPTEHELADFFDVSRPIVRDALSRLREDGLIYSRQGSGSYVRARRKELRPLGYARVETVADIQRCYEFRITIEPDAAFLAARRRNAEATEVIKRALDEMGDATRLKKHRAEADFAFHLAIAEAANNHYYSTSLSALKEHIAVGMKLHGISLMGPTPSLAHVFEEHEAIFAAIKNGEAETARDLMKRHLEGSRDRMFEGQVLDLRLK